MGRRHEPQEALGRAIRQLRDERGLKQKDLAQAADMNVTAISHLEHGRVNPRGARSGASRPRSA